MTLAGAPIGSRSLGGGSGAEPVIAPAIALGTIGSDATLFGPWLATPTPPSPPPVVDPGVEAPILPAGLLSPPRITAVLLGRGSPPYLKADLPDSFARRWQEAMNDTGSGSVTVHLDDPALALVQYGDLILFRIDGRACFPMVVEQVERHTVAPGEESAEVAVLSGRGTLALWEDAIVYPEPDPTAIPSRFTGGPLVAAPFTMTDPLGRGYWEVLPDGRLSAFTTGGTTLPHYGDLTGVGLAAPIVSGDAMPDGGGYVLLGTDGGVFSFGSSGFHGSAVGEGATCTAIALTPTGAGYRITATDRGIFCYGDAGFAGHL